MNSSNTSAIRSIFALSLENFFESKTDKEIQEMVLAPYREAHEDFEGSPFYCLYARSLRSSQFLIVFEKHLKAFCIHSHTPGLSERCIYSFIQGIVGFDEFWGHS